MRIKLTAKLEWRTSNPGVPNGSNCKDHFAHAWRRVAPFHAETFGDVRFDLATQAKNEATFRVRLQVPCGIGKRHWIAGECNCYRGADLKSAGVFGGKQQRQEGVVRCFGCPSAGVAGLL